VPKSISSGGETMSERHHGKVELTKDSKWRLLCLSVDVESNEAQFALLFREDVDLTQVERLAESLVSVRLVPDFKDLKLQWHFDFSNSCFTLDSKELSLFLLQ
jgi:hypothetical protein